MAGVTVYLDFKSFDCVSTQMDGELPQQQISKKNTEVEMVKLERASNGHNMVLCTDPVVFLVHVSDLTDDT